MSKNFWTNTALALFLTASCASVQAVGVSIIDLDDSNNAGPADDRELFDIATTTGTGPGSVLLTIGLSDFVASGIVGGSDVSAFDTLSFKVVVDPGYYITKITYNESGTTTTGAGGVTLSTGSVVSNGVANGLGLYLQNSPSSASGWSLTTSFTYAASEQLTEAAVSITNSLLAVGDAVISKDGASVTFEVTPVPIPPALGMLGAGLVGLATVARRKLSA